MGQGPWGTGAAGTAFSSGARPVTALSAGAPGAVQPRWPATSRTSQLREGRPRPGEDSPGSSWGLELPPPEDPWEGNRWELPSQTAWPLALGALPPVGEGRWAQVVCTLCPTLGEAHWLSRPALRSQVGSRPPGWSWGCPSPRPHSRWQDQLLWDEQGCSRRQEEGALCECVSKHTVCSLW